MTISSDINERIESKVLMLVKLVGICIDAVGPEDSSCTLCPGSCLSCPESSYPCWIVVDVGRNTPFGD